MNMSNDPALKSAMRAITNGCDAKSSLLREEGGGENSKVCAQAAAQCKPSVSLQVDDPTGIRIDFEISNNRLEAILKFTVELMKKSIVDYPPTPKIWKEAESTYEKLAYCLKHKEYKKRQLSSQLSKAIAELLYVHRYNLIPINSYFADDKDELSKDEIFNYEVWVGKSDTAFNATDYNTIAAVFGWAKNKKMILLAMTEIEVLYLRECEGIVDLDAYIHTRGSKKYASGYLNLEKDPEPVNTTDTWRIPFNNIKLPDLVYSDNCLVKNCIATALIKNDKEFLESLPLPAFSGGFRCLVEVFCRSCIISLRNLDNFDEIICNDADYKVINYFEIAKKYTKKLVEQIRLMIAECIRLIHNSPNGSSKEATEYIKECREVTRRSEVEQKIIAAAAFFILVNFSRQCSEKNLFSPDTFIKKADEDLNKMISHITYTSRFLHRIKFTNYDFRRIICKYDSKETIYILDPPYIRGFGIGCEDYSDGKNKRLVFSEKDMETVFNLPKHAACILFHSDKYRIANLADKYGYRLAGVYRTPNASYDTNVYTKNIPEDYNIWSSPNAKNKQKSPNRMSDKAPAENKATTLPISSDEEV